jgi:hypothetical protein
VSANPKSFVISFGELTVAVIDMPTKRPVLASVDTDGRAVVGNGDREIG